MHKKTECTLSLFSAQLVEVYLDIGCIPAADLTVIIEITSRRAIIPFRLFFSFCRQLSSSRCHRGTSVIKIRDVIKRLATFDYKGTDTTSGSICLL